MDKYRINYIFECEKNINDIFIEVLTREIKKYLETIDIKNKESSCGQFFLEGEENC